MTSSQDSQLLTRVGPGTPLGTMMREYWIPAAKAEELTADGPPLRLMLLGEKLIAFRDSAGRIGVMDHRCPHRCASLFFGRNEQGGIRCVYHGWKFDVDGRCLEQPNVPPQQSFASKVSAKAYKATERNGLIWVYMGSRAVPPPLPVFESALLGAAEMRILLVQRECSWLQALEGDLDTSHFGFLHAGSVSPEDVAEGNHSRFALVDRAPEYDVADTDWGTMYAARRQADPGRTYWRFAHFLFPFWTMPPDGDFKKHIVARAWVPMDDTHTMFVHLSWTGNSPPLRSFKDGRTMPGGGFNMKFLPNTDDWHGRWRLTANKGNDYQIDREVQRTQSFTGIEGIHLQDQAMTESMGGIVDHGFEHLAISDHMINRTRQRIVRATREMAEGTPPPGVDAPEIYQGARSGDFTSSDKLGWTEAYREELRASADPTGTLRVEAAE
jgi:phenylpropionate dioxygenase-like ring-hydroxylating dioxygenase large terminal subunit